MTARRRASVLAMLLATSVRCDDGTARPSLLPTPLPTPLPSLLPTAGTPRPTTTRLSSWSDVSDLADAGGEGDVVVDRVEATSTATVGDGDAVTISSDRGSVLDGAGAVQLFSLSGELPRPMRGRPRKRDDARSQATSRS